MRIVNFRDLQELPALDLTNISQFINETIAKLVMRAITGQKMVRGLTITQKSATEIYIAAGELWDGTTGIIYDLFPNPSDSGSQLTESVFSYLPITDQKYVTVSAFTAELDSDIEPRDFVQIINGQVTNPPQVQPSSVAMEHDWIVSIQLTPGQESPTPSKQSAPTGHVLLGYVLLNPGGIHAIENDTTNQLPNLFDHEERIESLENWEAATEPVVETLTSEYAALTQNPVDPSWGAKIAWLIAQVNYLLNQNQLPAPGTFSATDTDYFVDTSKSDIANPSYNARINEGLKFPPAASQSGAIQLFNPTDPTVVQYPDGLILPVPKSTTSLASLKDDYIAYLLISQYQAQTYNFRQGTPARRRWRQSTGLFANQASNNAASAIEDNLFEPGDSYAIEDDESLVISSRIDHYWSDYFANPYWYTINTPISLNGMQVAQTFLNSTTGWLSSVGVFFTAHGSTGTVYLHLCEVINGLPDLTRVIASSSVNPSDIKSADSGAGENKATQFVFSTPVFVKAGIRYAAVITTQGAHYLYMCGQSTFGQPFPTQQTPSYPAWFYNQSGAFIQGASDRFVRLNFSYLKFPSSFVQIYLTPLSLAGGMNTIDIISQAVVPNGTQLYYEYQMNGVWYPVNELTWTQLQALPDLLPFRVTFVGTNDAMPALRLTNSLVTLSRGANSFTHISTPRNLASTSTTIVVQLILKNWKPGSPANDVCDIKILSGTGYLTVHNPDAPGSPPQPYIDTLLPDGSTLRKATFTLALNTFKIEILGSTDTPLDAFSVAQRTDIES